MAPQLPLYALSDPLVVTATSAPEPSTFTFGVAGLAVFIWRRRQSS